MKTLTVLISGELQSRRVRVERGATAKDLVEQLGIPSYRLVYLIGENPLPPETDLHEFVANLGKLLAFPEMDYRLDFDN